MNTRIENWNGYKIRFVKLSDGEWWAVLKDVCDALKLQTRDVSKRIGDEFLEKVPIEMDRKSVRPNSYKNHHVDSTHIVKSSTTSHMLVINEYGIYEALFASRKLEARKFRHWTATVMKRLRQDVGLKSYEVLRMTDQDIQDEIDFILDTIYYDPERQMLMRSITVPGGDVEQVPYF